MTTQRSELVERLRQSLRDREGDGHHRTLIAEAADTIESQASLISEAVAALDDAAGRLRWIAKNEPGSRPDVNFRWAEEAKAALTRLKGEQ